MAGSNDTNVTDDSPKVLRYIYVRVYDIVDLPEPEGPKMNNTFIYINSRTYLFSIFSYYLLACKQWHNYANIINIVNLGHK